MISNKETKLLKSKPRILTCATKNKAKVVEKCDYHNFSSTANTWRIFARHHKSQRKKQMIIIIIIIIL